MEPENKIESGELRIENSQPPITSHQPPITNRGSGLVSFMNSIPAKLMGLFKKKNTAPVVQAPNVPYVAVPSGLTKNYKKIILLGGGVLIAFVLLGTLVVYLLRPKPVAVVPTPTPEALAPIATPTPTKYATDSAVLKLEENLKILDQNLGNTDLSEDTIKPRSLDFNVSFR